MTDAEINRLSAEMMGKIVHTRMKSEKPDGYQLLADGHIVWLREGISHKWTIAWNPAENIAQAIEFADAMEVKKAIEFWQIDGSDVVVGDSEGVETSKADASSRARTLTRLVIEVVGQSEGKEVKS